MAYIKPEYARHGKYVMVSVPFDLNRNGVLRSRPKTFKSLIRQGMKRSFFRKLVAARVVQFPLLPHTYHITTPKGSTQAQDCTLH